MPLQTTGTICLADIAKQFPKTGVTVANLSDFYAGGGRVPANTKGTNGAIPTAGKICLTDFYGAPLGFSISIAIIGGGGGGGNMSTGHVAGAGGAGGVLYGTLNLTAGTYHYTTGAPGQRGDPTGTNGQDSTFSGPGITGTLTAFGGGGGGSDVRGGTQYDGLAGGSGGGAGGELSHAKKPGAATQTSQGGLTGYGNVGGTPLGNGSAVVNRAAGGGAGGPAVHNVNGSGMNVVIAGKTYNVAAGGEVPGYGAVSTDHHGDGGRAEAAGQHGAILIGSSTGKTPYVVTNPAGTIVIDAAGNIKVT